MSFVAPGAHANMFVYVFKQLGVAGGAHEKKTLVCPVVAGQPMGVKSVADEESEDAVARAAAAAAADAGARVPASGAAAV